MNLIEPGLGHLAVATDILLAPYGHDETVLGGLLAGVFAARDCDYADLYFQFTRNEAWTLENGIVQSGRFSIDRASACARCRATARRSRIPTT